MKRSFCSLALAVSFVWIAASAFAAKKPLNGRIALEDQNGKFATMNDNATGLSESTNTLDISDAEWSPDGTRVAVVVDSNGAPAIVTMNPDGTNAVPIIPTNHDFFPAWSPDGKQIAFTSARDGNNEIYTMRADGALQTRLTINGADDREPSFAPDGKTLIFVSDRTGRDEMWRMNLDGSGLVQITTDNDDKFSPKFSPDGKRIVFERLDGFYERDEVCVMNADGSNLVIVSKADSNFCGLCYPNLIGFHASVSFSPDGKRVAYSQTKNNELDVFTANPDGTNEQRVAPGLFYSWQPVSPVDTVGVYRPSTGQWLLRGSNTSGGANATITFGGQFGDLPVVGDWNGDGRSDIGIFRNGTFLLAILKTAYPCLACLPVTTAEDFATISFGAAGDRPVAGDWNGDTVDDIGVFRPTDNSSFILRVPHFAFFRACPTCPLQSNTTFTAESHAFGARGDSPVSGDWDNNGQDDVGVWRPGFPGTFILSTDLIEPGITFNFGSSGDKPLAGDWTGRFADRVGVFRGLSGRMLLATQFSSTADIVFDFGAQNDLPVAGHWQIIAF